MLPNEQSITPAIREFASMFRNTPPLHSFATQWQSISMCCVRQTVYELPEASVPLHCIAIFTTPSISKRTIDGISKNESNNPGDIVVVPSNIGISSRWKGEGDMIVIGLDTFQFIHAIDDVTNFNPTELVPQFATPDPLVYQLGLSLKNVLERDSAGSRLYAETIAAMLAVHLLQHYGQRKLEFKDYADGLPRSTLHRVIEYIHTNLDRDLGLAELAAIAHLSPHYFTRLFKRSTGYTPHQFVLRCRVERAKSLLLNGKDAIAEVAQQVGFANQAHLNVHVKRSLGVTPKTIREQSKNR